MLKLQGSIEIPGDKSISHRALIFAALSTGKTKISNLLESEDIKSTINVLISLGISIKKYKNYWIVLGNGTSGFMQPNGALDCGNSGTTARLMLGAVSTNPIVCTFIGDKSLSKRSMSRVTNYLKKIGAEVSLTRGDYFPAMVKGDSNLLPLNHEMVTASAQVKSALMLAGLSIHGKTAIIEKRPTRDHTERLMKYLNLKFKKIKKGKNGSLIELNGPYEIKPRDLKVACDPSSAAFFIVGALIIRNSKITLKNILLNPTRIEFINVLKKMGGKIKISNKKVVCGETVGSISAEYSKLKGTVVKASLSSLLIDEYPILAIAAIQSTGVTKFNGLDELRHKESDRIKSITQNLKRLGFNVITQNNNIIIHGSKHVVKKSVKIRTFNDHRIAMAFSILSIIYEYKISLDNEKCIAISYPDFKKHIKELLVNA